VNFERVVEFEAFIRCAKCSFRSVIVVS